MFSNWVMPRLAIAGAPAFVRFQDVADRHDFVDRDRGLTVLDHVPGGERPCIEIDRRFADLAVCQHDGESVAGKRLALEPAAHLGLGWLFQRHGYNECIVAELAGVAEDLRRRRDLVGRQGIHRMGCARRRRDAILGTGRERTEA